MNKHILFPAVTIFGWLFFYLIGLPFNYFLTTPTLYKILLLLFTFFSFFHVLTFILLSFLKGDYPYESR